MAREKVDNKLNVVIGTKAQIEGDASIPDNSIIVVTDEELNADEIAYSVEKNVKEAIEDLEVSLGDIGNALDAILDTPSGYLLTLSSGMFVMSPGDSTYIYIKLNTPPTSSSDYDYQTDWGESNLNGTVVSDVERVYLFGTGEIGSQYVLNDVYSDVIWESIAYTNAIELTLTQDSTLYIMTSISD